MILAPAPAGKPARPRGISSTNDRSRGIPICSVRSSSAAADEWTRAGRLDASRLVDGASGWSDHPGVGGVHEIHVDPGPGAPPTEPRRAAMGPNTRRCRSPTRPARRCERARRIGAPSTATGSAGASTSTSGSWKSKSKAGRVDRSVLGASRPRPEQSRVEQRSRPRGSRGRLDQVHPEARRGDRLAPRDGAAVCAQGRPRGPVGWLTGPRPLPLGAAAAGQESEHGRNQPPTAPALFSVCAHRCLLGLVTGPFRPVPWYRRLRGWTGSRGSVESGPARAEPRRGSPPGRCGSSAAPGNGPPRPDVRRGLPDDRQCLPGPLRFSA